MESFDYVWRFLRSNLRSGTKVKNWTVHKGYLGDIMTILEIGESYVEVDSPRAQNIQNVPKKDFEAVWKIWSDYKVQKVKRSDLTPITRFSKYIISILHWYDLHK
jgi:hypothetical protein